jgi:uncharacterized protein (DUF1501 family)
MNEPAGITRRHAIALLSVAGVGLSTVRPLRAIERMAHAKSAASPRGVARNVVFVFLEGGPSHVDTFDLKVGSWTPEFLGAADTGSSIGMWPYGMMPDVGERLDRIAVLRSLHHREQVHERARFVTQSGHNVNPALAAETPHLGAVVAYELEGLRRPDDPLPSFLALGGVSVGTGFLPNDLSPFDPVAGGGVAPLEHPFGEQRFARRLALLEALQGRLDSGNRHAGYVQRAAALMSDPEVQQVLTPTEDDVLAYGDSESGRVLAIAARVLKAELGARVVHVSLGGWDQHQSIYDGNGTNSIAGLAGPLDRALAALIDDLADSPGVVASRLLDETLIVVRGEFGRTPGPLNDQGGRDHHSYAFAGLVAGAGVVGGRALGVTSPEGAWIDDNGWGRNRPIYPQDLAATVYSALGIDWTTVVTDTPSRRPFSYVEDDPYLSPFTEVRELWGDPTPEV